MAALKILTLSSVIKIEVLKTHLAFRFYCRSEKKENIQDSTVNLVDFNFDFRQFSFELKIITSLYTNTLTFSKIINHTSGAEYFVMNI